MKNNILQFELWRQCNCKCTFCTLGEDNLYTSDELKIQVLTKTLNTISLIKPKEYTSVGLIGGEFFQGQLENTKVKNLFLNIIKELDKKITKGYINEIWINASLLLGKQIDLYETLQGIENINATWILTSYDTLGRFHTEKMENNWKFHMKNIKKLYPDIKINTTLILTKHFINLYNIGEFDIKGFEEAFNTSIFIKNPVVPDNMLDKTKLEINNILGDFFPDRKETLSFFKKFILKEGLDEYNKLMNMALKANQIIKNYNCIDKQDIKFVRDLELQYETEENSLFDTLLCGHNTTCSIYTDSQNCVFCDKKMIFEEFSEII